MKGDNSKESNREKFNITIEISQKFTYLKD